MVQHESETLVQHASVKVVQHGPKYAVPVIVPDLYGHLNTGAKRGVAGWGDAATIIPWTLFRMYNDTGVLREQYDSMKAWVDYINDEIRDGLWTANGYGDWLAAGDSTSLPFIDQCFWAYSTRLLVEAARVLGRAEDVVYYSALLQRVKETFLRAYIDSNGRAVTHTQTAYVLALQFDMLPEAMRRLAVEHLAQLIRDNRYRLATGFLGTPYLLHVLSDNGHADVAYRLLMQKECPSWLYPITKGATTIWEKWDAIKPDGTIQPASFNHYAYGAVGDWLYEGVLGIKPLEPGFRKVLITPQVGEGLRWARGRYRTGYGVVGSGWRVRGKKLVLKVRVPKGVSAEVRVPGGGIRNVGEGRWRLVTRHESWLAPIDN